MLRVKILGNEVAIVDRDGDRDYLIEVPTLDQDIRCGSTKLVTRTTCKAVRADCLRAFDNARKAGVPILNDRRR